MIPWSRGSHLIFRDFYYETDGNGSGGTAIAACQNQGEGTNQLCAWDTTGVPVNAYYVYGVADDGVNTPVTVVSSETLDITAAGGGQFNITACSHCHAEPPTDGTARDNPEGAVLGAHSISYHDAGNCGNCHVEPGATEYDHRDGNIEMLATIHGQTGSSYSKGTSFPQTNSPALGTCSTTYCHGTTSFSWDENKSSFDYCTICHGKETTGADKTATDANPYLRAPGADGTGVDTGGDTANIDAQVGAHQSHLTGAEGISDPVVCGECHAVPTAPNDAGHWDTSGSRDAAELTFNGPIGDTDGNDNPLSISYSSSQCSNTYCHDGRNFKNGWSTAAQIDFEAPTWNQPIISGGVGYDPDGNICDNCHGYPPAGSHDSSSDCSSCHDHVDATDDGFTGAPNIAKHINHMVEASSDCMSCHNQAQSEAYNPRQIVENAGDGNGDFVKASRHVSDGTLNQIVTNYDCVVCHAEGDADAVAAGTGWTSGVHKNGSTATDRYVKLRNVDNYGGATFDFNKNTVDETMRDNMDTFCLNCHDVDGASTIAVNNTNDGMFLGASASSTTRQGQGVTTNLMPFNTNDNLRNANDGFTTRTRVVDVKSQYNTGNPSHHAVLGARYSTTDADWVSGTWTTHTLRDTSLPGGGVMNVVRETATLHCSDCHLSETNAHGAVNAWHMLLNGTPDDYASDEVMTGESMSNTASVVCYKCHNSSVYTHDEDGKWQNGTYGDRTADSAHLGPGCLLCHAGDGFGRIHGRGSATDGDDGTYSAGGTYSKYRFMPGAWMKWSPGGASGTDSDWDTSNAGATCYFPASTETTWNSCNTHDGSTRGSSTNYDRARTY
jgi:hypothetical protein